MEEKSTVAQNPYTVVVGVSNTSKSPIALEWAVAQAKAQGGRVIAVRAWQQKAPAATPSGTSAGRIPRPIDIETEARNRLAADVADVLGEDHGVEIRLEKGGRRGVLVKAARGADLLVLDAPRALGSTPMFAHRIIYAARCPVVVMPPKISGEPPSWLVRVAKVIGEGALRSAGTAGRPGMPATPRKK